MSLNSTPSGDRLHIAFFGRRNAGKSSLVNAVTGQELSVVSDVKGTTTDPVSKAMELLPAGPVMIIDTPGFDDSGDIGELRVKKTMQILNRTDIAIVVIDSAQGKTPEDESLVALIRKKNIPMLTVYNKSDLAEIPTPEEDGLSVSAACGIGITELKERIAELAKGNASERKIIGDMIKPGDMVVLVTPIDASAPKGRLILPQQMTIRDILDAGAVCAVTKETELSLTLSKLSSPPALVITDSQAFGFVSRIVPEDVPLTSFSILMARFKGFLETAAAGAAVINTLRDGDKILISEGCTHHRQCGDIGTVKLPVLLKKYTGAHLEITFTSGRDFPEDVSQFRLVIHCGGCMLNEREVNFRMRSTLDAGSAFTNYGTALALMNGILPRSLSIFPQLRNKLTI